MRLFLILKIYAMVLAIIVFLIISACKSDEVTSEERKDEKSDVIFTDRLESNLSVPVFKALQSEIIQIGSIDFELLDYLVFNGINGIREQKGFAPLKISGVLIAAARNQNQYQIKINKLSHHQTGQDLKSAALRVKYYGGDYRSIGENVQFQGFTIRTQGGIVDIITPTYIAAADKIVQGWVNSPGHYQNIINPDFTYVGTSIDYSPIKKALFATQVYGGFFR